MGRPRLEPMLNYGDQKAAPAPEDHSLPAFASHGQPRAPRVPTAAMLAELYTPSDRLSVSLRGSYGQSAYRAQAARWTAWPPFCRRISSATSGRGQALAGLYLFIFYRRSSPSPARSGTGPAPPALNKCTWNHNRTSFSSLRYKYHLAIIPQLTIATHFDQDALEA